MMWFATVLFNGKFVTKSGDEAEVKAWVQSQPGIIINCRRGDRS